MSRQRSIRKTLPCMAITTQLQKIVAKRPARRSRAGRTDGGDAARTLVRFLRAGFPSAWAQWLKRRTPKTFQNDAGVVSSSSSSRSYWGDHLCQRALGGRTAVERRNDRLQSPPFVGESWRPISAPRCNRMARRSSASSQQQYSFVPAMHRRARPDTPVVFRVTSPDVIQRILDLRHQCEQHGRAGIRRRSANALRPSPAST